MSQAAGARGVPASLPGPVPTPRRPAMDAHPAGVRRPRSHRASRIGWGPTLIVLVFGLGIGSALAFRARPGTARHPIASVAARPAPHKAAGPSLLPALGNASLDPAQVSFRDVYGAAVPVSPAGPHHIGADGQVSGFDQTPAGAVEAAASISYAASPVQPMATLQATVANQVVGPDQAAFLAQLESQQPAATPDPAQIGAARAARLGVWAYRVGSYTPSLAQVDLLVRASSAGGTAFVSFATQVQWSGQDWRLVAPLGGNWQSAATPAVSVPPGYTVIGANR